MKTMMSVDGKKILRVTEDKARELYMEGFRFIPKSEWKEKVRDINTEVIVDDDTGQRVVSINKSNKPSKSQKRHMKKANK